MTRTIPDPRHEKIRLATAEAKRTLMSTKDWKTTRRHMEMYLRGKYALSRTTIADYLTIIHAQMQGDKEVSKYVV